MKGRPPKPIAQHILSGTFRSDRHSTDTPKPLEGVPKCPARLGDDAKKVWREVVRIMKAAGIITQADGWVMARFCTSVVRLRDAEAELDKYRISSAINDQGRSVIKSLYVIVRGETETMMSTGALLGLDPVSRTRLHCGDVGGSNVPSPEVRSADIDLPPPEVG